METQSETDDLLTGDSSNVHSPKVCMKHMIQKTGGHCMNVLKSAKDMLTFMTYISS